MLTAIHGLPPLDDDRLEELGRRNPGWRFERDDDGATVMDPAHTGGGAQSAEALRQLAAWREATGIGGKIYDSSTGFKMSTGAVRSPDAAWLSAERIAALSESERRGLWRVCPDVAVEILSSSDDITDVAAKCEMYLREGARYAILIDPFRREAAEFGDRPSGLTFDIDRIAGA